MFGLSCNRMIVGKYTQYEDSNGEIAHFQCISVISGFTGECRKRKEFLFIEIRQL